MTPEINIYIEKRYSNWLDYSTYHCTHAGIADESIDVLNEVIVALLQKCDCRLLSLLNSKKGKYTELDFYVLRMIKLNIYSGTSPYQSKYRPMPSANIDIRRLSIEDIIESDEDIPARVLEQFELVRETFESLNLSPKAKRIFEYKFFQDQPFSEWSGPETKKQLYEIYSQVVNMIRAKIFKKTLL